MNQSKSEFKSFLKEFFERLSNTETPFSETQNFLSNFIKSKCFISEDINWHTMLQEIHDIPKATCGKLVKEGELYFKCLDCSVKGSHVICEECFQRSDHKNHKFIYITTSWGFCDCGDETCISKNGFCHVHRTEVINEKAIINKIPKPIRKKLRSLFVVMFSETFHTIEEQWKTMNSSAHDQSSLNLLLCILEVIALMIDDSFCLLMFFANFLIKPLKNKETKDEDFSFYHDCNNKKEISFSAEKKTCQCSILGFLFKFNQILSKNLSEKIVAIGFKLSSSFRLQIHIMFLLQCNVHQIFNLKTIQQNGEEIQKFSLSELGKLRLLSHYEKMAKVFTESSDFFLIFEKIQKEYDLLQHSSSHDQIMLSIRHIFDSFLYNLNDYPSVCYFLIKEVNVLEKMLLILLSKKESKEFYNEKKEISIFWTNDAFFFFIKKLIKMANDHEEKEILTKLMIKIFGKILGEMFLCSEKEKNRLMYLKKMNKLEQDIHFINNVASKIFGLFMGFFLQKFDYNLYKVNQFLNDILKSQQIIPEDFVENMSTQIILSLFSKFMINYNEGNTNF